MAPANDFDEVFSDGPVAAAVLVVDDEPVVCEVLSRLLSREQDISVVTASSAEEALPILSGRRFELVIADKNLPGKSGVELIAEASRMWPNVEAILITGYPSAESILAAMAVGASDYLTKPFSDIQVVRARIRAALERRTERVEARRRARALARAASDLLDQGEHVPDAVWDLLERRMKEYEAAIEQGGVGTVHVVGREQVAAALREDGIEVTHVAADAPALTAAEVVVLDTELLDWESLADRLEAAGCDLLLVGGPHADVGDLLDAIARRRELVGLNGPALKGAPARIRSILMRRAVQRAQVGLSEALAEFRRAFEGTGR